MKLKISSGDIILPKDFRFEIKQSHPFFSGEGSASVPATLPPTPGNMRALQQPADINRATRFSKQFDAMLYSGSYFRRCRMVVESGQTLGGIDMSLALDESEAYSELQDKQLRDILAEEFFTVAGRTPFQVYEQNDRRDCVFFPVACDVKGEGNSAVVQQLNSPTATDFVSGARNIPHGSGNDTVAVPAGYGLTCFLRLPELIAKVFTLCGYTVRTNVFLTDNRLKTIVLLNSCADAMLSGTYSSSSWRVHYPDICPSITVGDLIGWMRDKFGAVCLISGKVVDIRLFQDLCDGAPDFDFTKYIREDSLPKLTYPNPKALVLSMDTSLEGAAPAADSLEALRSSHPNMAEADSVSSISGNGLRFVKPLGKYYFRNENWGTPTLLGSNAFPYKRTTVVKETEERKTSDTFAPMILTASMYMPYVGKTIRRNIDIDDLEKDAEQKIMLCNAIYTNGHWQGSQYATDMTGQSSVNVMGLIPETIYTNFWEAYHRIIINGAPEITCTVTMRREQLLSLNLWTTKLIKGMKAFIKSISYSLGDSPVITAEIIFQSVPSYTNGIAIPGAVTFGTAFGWQRYVDDDQSDLPYGPTTDYEVIAHDGLANYTAADAPSWAPTYLGQKAKARERWYDIEETHYGYLSGHRQRHYYEEGFVAVYSD